VSSEPQPRALAIAQKHAPPSAGARTCYARTHYPLSSSARRYAAAATDNLEIRRPDLRGVRRFGAVRWLEEDKGYGRITADDGEVLWFHFSSIVGDGYRSAEAGQRVRSARGSALLVAVAVAQSIGPRGRRFLDLARPAVDRAGLGA
jgi:cold shock CspA family protein